MSLFDTLNARIEAVAAGAEVRAETASELATLSAAHDAEYNGPMSDILFPFQRAGVAYALKTRRVILGDEMGLGKTPQALAATRAAGGSTLVVVPPSLRYDWGAKIRQFLPDATYVIIEGTTAYASMVTEAKAADYVIVGYSSLQRGDWPGILAGEGKPGDEDYAAPLVTFDNLVVDESHKIKNYKAAQSKAVLAIAKLVTTGLVLLLTGTAIKSRPAELLNQLLALGDDVLDRLMVGKVRKSAFKAFQFEFCGPTRNAYSNSGWDFKGASNLDDLHSRLRATCYVRREKSEVLTDLPPILPDNIVTLELNGALKTYHKAEADLIKFLQDTKGGEAAARARRAQALVTLNTLRNLVAQAKVDAAVEHVTDWLDSNTGKIVVFAGTVAAQEALVEAFDCPAILSQDRTNGEQIEAAKDEFNNGSARVIVCSLWAATEGHTLVAQGQAADVLFVDFGWTPAEHAQALARIHRIGQTADRVQATYLIARGTIDEDSYSLLVEKGKILKAVLSGGSTDVSNESIANALLDILKGR